MSRNWTIWKKNFVEKIQSYLWHDLISPLIGLLSLFGQVDAGFLEPIISTPDQCIHNSIEWFNSGGRKRNSHGKKKHDSIFNFTKRGPSCTSPMKYLHTSIFQNGIVPGWEWKQETVHLHSKQLLNNGPGEEFQFRRPETGWTSSSPAESVHR